MNLIKRKKRIKGQLVKVICLNYKKFGTKKRSLNTNEQSFYTVSKWLNRAYLYFFKYQNTIDIIRNEINNLRCKRATVQVCLKAIKSRENCISLLRSTLGSNYFDLKNKGIFFILELVDKCCEIITHLRILNINVTESVFKWREGLLRDFQIQDNQIIVIPFIYEKHNYLLKVISLI